MLLCLAAEYLPSARLSSTFLWLAKNALPPQSKRTLLMIKEMTRLGLHGNRNLYHVAFSACAMAGDHRRTGQIFKIMMADGVKPSSGTYDLIVKTVSKYCKAEDSAEIYDSLKLSGVPERIAYVAAFKAGSRYVSRLEETTAKYYKLDSRERKIFERHGFVKVIKNKGQKITDANNGSVLTHTHTIGSTCDP